MTAKEAFDKLLPSFKDYYNINTENVLSPFVAEAEFVSHQEQYFLVKSAKLSDIDSKDHVYFAVESELTLGKASEMCLAAWDDGLKNVQPYYGHRNSDVTVFILCENTDIKTIKKCRKFNFSKSYKMMLYGWSHFKLVILNTDTNKLYYNRYGGEYHPLMKKFVKRVCRNK